MFSAPEGQPVTGQEIAGRADISGFTAVFVRTHKRHQQLGSAPPDNDRSRYAEEGGSGDAVETIFQETFQLVKRWTPPQKQAPVRQPGKGIQQKPFVGVHSGGIGPREQFLLI